MVPDGEGFLFFDPFHPTLRPNYLRDHPSPALVMYDKRARSVGELDERFINRKFRPF